MVLFAAKLLNLQELYFATQISTCDLDSGALNHSEIDVSTMASFIITSSRGFFEVATVQLVHESVRKDLLAGGLARMDSSTAKDLNAHWHSDLFRCCRTYIKLDHDAHCALRQKLEQSPDDVTATAVL